MNFLLRSTSHVKLHSSQFGFATVAADKIAGANYVKFQKKYHEFVNNFNEKMYVLSIIY